MAAERVSAHAIGLRLCGIVEEPPRPLPPGSETSATSFCIMSETSRAILPRLPVSTPQAHISIARRSRCACHGAAGHIRSSSCARAFDTEIPSLPRDARVPLAPPNWRMSASPKAASSFKRLRRIALSQPATFNPNVIGGAACKSVRPNMTVLLCWSDNLCNDDSISARSLARIDCACLRSRTSAVSPTS